MKPHKNLRTAEIKQSEKGVQQLLHSFGNVMNPLVADQPELLICLLSGAVIT